MTRSDIMFDYVYTMKEIHINPYIKSGNPFKRLLGKFLKRRLYKKIENIDINKIHALDYGFIRSWIDFIDVTKSSSTSDIYEKYNMVLTGTTSCSINVFETIQRDWEHFNINNIIYRLTLSPRSKQISIKFSLNSKTKGFITKRFKSTLDINGVDGTVDDMSNKAIELTLVFIKDIMLTYIDHKE